MGVWGRGAISLVNFKKNAYFIEIYHTYKNSIHSKYELYLVNKRYLELKLDATDPVQIQFLRKHLCKCTDSYSYLSHVPFPGEAHLYSISASFFCKKLMEPTILREIVKFRNPVNKNSFFP